MDVYAWQRAGWQPFVIETVVGIDKDYLRLTGVNQGLHLSLYLRRVVTHHQHQQVLSEHNLAHIKALSGGHFQLSILLPQGPSTTLYAYSMLAQARDGRGTPADPAQFTRSDGRSVSPTKLYSVRRYKAQHKQTKLTERPAAITIMALAFRNAQENQADP
ncbi:hypothetical protein BKM07_21120 [Pseudomonas syringae group genomosp. 3]|uniref:Uncharacterized protein n=1 Tax=Pseudomonas syringae group genomosp. 3 TaxID=251701 RepID=A0ABD6V741_9PSED|nr:hypothetical protein BKM07_21120 [Pseudomonas syringae group genomosp. 3]